MRLWAALFAAILSLVALPGAASAVTVQVTGDAVGPYPIGDFERDGVVWYSAGITKYRYVGTYVPGGEPAEFLGYCVDFLAPEISGLYTISPLSAYFPDAATQQLITVLLGNTTALEDAAVGYDAKQLIRTATQLAIWEIAEETGGVLGTETGSFKAFDNPDHATYAPARSLADQYLAKASSVWTALPGVRAQLLYDDELQSAVYLAPVPEPATWAMMISGLGVVGGSLRARRRQAAIA